MLHFQIKKNESQCCKLPPAKVFDPASKQLVDEPSVIIDPKIDYRSMSIQVQMENGTLGDKMDFSDFGCNKLDMSDRISSIASEINEDMDKIDLKKKEEEQLNALLEEINKN